MDLNLGVNGIVKFYEPSNQRYHCIEHKISLRYVNIFTYFPLKFVRAIIDYKQNWISKYRLDSYLSTSVFFFGRYGYR